MAHAAPTHPFDALAAEYDTAFTDHRLGRWLRSIVWQRMEWAFGPGQHLLELGCGTGEDAVWLAKRGLTITATDASEHMLESTREKAERAGVGNHITTSQLDLAALAANDNDTHIAAGHSEPAEESRCCSRIAGDALSVDHEGLAGNFDGAYSNFGPLNCIVDRRPVIAALARLVRPGGRVVIVMMGPICPREIAWHIGRFRFRTAFRRLRSGSAARVGKDGSVNVWYPSQRRLKREFGAYFRTLEIAGVGLLLPTSEMGRVVERAPRLFKLLARLDRRFAGSFPWRWLNDHYLMVLERR